MLYLSTRDPHEAFTAHKALTEDTTVDGGLYIPFKLPEFDTNELDDLLNLGFCEIVAEVLNRFFSCRFNAWDVETCIGRTPVKIGTPGRKTLIAETWYNPGGCYDYAVETINDMLLGADYAPVRSWTRVAVGAAFTFGVYGELVRSCLLDREEKFDICVPDGDMSLPAAMIYARQMGLPVNKVVVSSRDNSALWDFVNHGQLGTSLLTPAQKVGSERLICSLLGQDQCQSYAAACQRHGVYLVPEEKMQALSNVMFASVVGKDRIQSVIGNVFNTSGYMLASDAAACYGGIQDYRSQTGQGGLSVLFGLTAPKA